MLKKIYEAVLGRKQSYNGSSQDHIISSTVYAILDIFKYKKKFRVSYCHRAFILLREFQNVVPIPPL